MVYKLNLLFVLWTVQQCFEHDVRLQVVQDLVVTKVTVFGQIENGSLLVKLIVLVIVDFNEALSDEIHLLHITFVADDTLSWRRDTAIHLDNQLICEASLTFLEEMVERSLELFKDTRVLNKISLHLGCDLLVELELLYYEIKIV